MNHAQQSDLVRIDGFGNIPMREMGILAILAGSVLLFLGAFVGVETGFGLRVVNLPTTISGAVFFISGVVLFAAGGASVQKCHAD